MEIIATKPTCNWGGIVILEANDEVVTSAEDYGNGLLRKATARVRYNLEGEPYFMRQGRREYLKDYMKVG